MKINVKYHEEEFPFLCSQLIGKKVHYRHVLYFKKMMDIFGAGLI